MAKTLEKGVVAAIEQAILTAQKTDKNADLRAIAGTFKCSYQSVCYIRRRMEKQQRTGIDERKKSGRKPTENQDRMAIFLKNVLATRPDLEQSTLSDLLCTEFGVRLSQATISRMLKINAIPHKITNKVYEKSQLFVTDSKEPKPVGMVSDVSREVAANALSSLPKKVYQSPYPPTDRIPQTTTYGGLAAPSMPMYDGTLSLGMPFLEPPNQIGHMGYYRSPYS